MVGFQSSQVWVLTAEAIAEMLEIGTLDAILANCFWGIVDQNRSFTKYAPIVADEFSGALVPDLANVRCFFDDSVVLHNP